MRRRTFDALTTAIGLGLAVVLLIACGLLAWGSSFVNNEVHSQLAAQKIFFPPKGSPALADPQIKPFLTPYAGQQLLNGQQAQVWADHFIAVHLQKIGGGKTYAQLSSASLAQPKNVALAGQVQTVFRGETLRGLLLNAYAFWKIGQLMLIAAIVAGAAAVVMLILSGLGFAHLRRVSPEAEVFPKTTGRTTTPVPGTPARNGVAPDNTPEVVGSGAPVS
jgi:hypothetical protein